MKAKTHKATAKRFMVKKSKHGTKVMKRTDGQNHFNSRETGNTKRNKRSDNIMSRTVQQTLLRCLPNS